MTGSWKEYAYAAAVDLAAAHLATREAEVLEHLRDALDNVIKAIDAVGREEEGEE